MQVNVHIDEKTFKCKCGNSYSSNKALKDHIKTVLINMTVHSCHICGKQLRDKYKLKYQMVVNKDERILKERLLASSVRGVGEPEEASRESPS